VSRDAKTITESPWFWATLFAAAALVGLTMVGPKYLERQSKLEQRFQARKQMYADRLAGKGAADEGGAEREAEGEGPAAEQTPTRPPAPRRPTLIPLAAIVLAILLAGWWGVFHLRLKRAKEEKSGAAGAPSG
jgi:hypothetical protein